MLNVNIMKRIHITDSEVIIKSKTYCQFNKTHKPAGLWYTINEEWLEWCKIEMPGWINKYQFELDIDLSKILMIKNTIDLKLFNKKYTNSALGIEWNKVAEKYDGIEIQNYSYLMNHVKYDSIPLWVWGWDISSGCIWNLAALKGINKSLVNKKWFSDCMVGLNSFKF